MLVIRLFGKSEEAMAQPFGGTKKATLSYTTSRVVQELRAMTSILMPDEMIVTGC